MIFMGVGEGEEEGYNLHNGRYTLTEAHQYARFLFLQGAPLSDMLVYVR